MPLRAIRSFQRLIIPAKHGAKTTSHTSITSGDTLSKLTHLEGLVGAAFIYDVFGNASFNEATGFTKATYKYAEYDCVTVYYEIESELPIIADDRGWTKTFV